MEVLLWPGLLQHSWGLGQDCRPAPHLRGTAALAGGPRKEPGPSLPSGISLFPTGFDINEVITGCVYAPVP